jgi:hypothetical protein
MEGKELEVRRSRRVMRRQTAHLEFLSGPIPVVVEFTHCKLSCLFREFRNSPAPRLS